VTGCGANLQGAAFEDVAANVTVVRGAPEAVPRIVAGWVGDLGCAGPRPAFPRTRAYVKIQDGCSFTCSYCVIPQVRGKSRSRRAADVLSDVARRARQGHREVVLTGINLGCFRDRAAGMRLPDLLARAAGVDGIDRVRLSSIEVNHVSGALLGAMAHPGVARHLHVPMQSGDDGVLAAMRRRYTATAFLRAMGRARERVPGVNLTTDVIVGHPAEDDAAFERTLAAVRAAGFTRVHVFPYSPRPGTADEASDPVPAAVKAERSRRLRELGERQARAHRRALRGTRQLVLVETEAGRGYADDYTPLVVPGGRPGTMVEVVA
jgi:threonylcarbamoyladenosine tRNA methylthiotransferase MtaB